MRERLSPTCIVKLLAGSYTAGAGAAPYGRVWPPHHGK